MSEFIPQEHPDFPGWYITEAGYLRNPSLHVRIMPNATLRGYFIWDEDALLNPCPGRNFASMREAYCWLTGEIQ